jgi:hypothetical protein
LSHRATATGSHLVKIGEASTAGLASKVILDHAMEHPRPHHLPNPAPETVLTSIIAPRMPSPAVCINGGAVGGPAMVKLN